MTKTSKGPRREYRFHGVKMLTASHPDIRRVKRSDAQPSIHGNKLWRSSFLLIDYLTKHPPQHAKTVLDAGCGWGMSGIFCAKKFGSKGRSDLSRTGYFPPFRSYRFAVDQPTGRTAHLLHESRQAGEVVALTFFEQFSLLSHNLSGGQTALRHRQLAGQQEISGR